MDPPEEWRHQPRACLPCTEAVWIQDRKYDIEYFWWQFWLDDVHTGWGKDWDETDYEREKVSVYPWSAFSTRWYSSMYDNPGVGLAKSVFFSAISKVKCIAGENAGKIYATVRWGYYDFTAGDREWSGGGLGYY